MALCSVVEASANEGNIERASLFVGSVHVQCAVYVHNTTPRHPAGSCAWSLSLSFLFFLLFFAFDGACICI
jgi:hypothetical protein